MILTVTTNTDSIFVYIYVYIYTYVYNIYVLYKYSRKIWYEIKSSEIRVNIDAVTVKVYNKKS